MKITPYICCGDISIEFSKKLAMLFSHCEIIELGIPFSDPIADGKTIQEASQRALANGMNTDKAFDFARKLMAEGVASKLVFMTYYNIVHAYGKERFVRSMKEAGVDGIIIPDLPFREDEEFEEMARKHMISIVNLIAGNTSEKRAKEILENETLFTYLVSTYGITGSRQEADKAGIELVRRTRAIAGKGNKLYVGFGITSPEQVKKYIEAGADGTIIGSAIIDTYSKAINEGSSEEKVLESIKEFAETFK